MTTNGSKPVPDRPAERRRAVALAMRYRELEGLSIAQIAHRLGRSPATVKAYFYDRSAPPLWMKPGETVLTRMPCGASWLARPLL